MLAIVVILVVGGFITNWIVPVGMGRGLDPLPALARLVPEGVGVVVRAEPIEGSCDLTRITLDTGATLDLQLTKVRCDDWPWSWKSPVRNLSEASVSDGGVLYYGHDWFGSEWIAGTFNHPGPPSCPFILKGGYDEGDTLHLTSGLVVRKALGYRASPSWVENPRAIHSADDICVDREGRATSLSIFLPY